MRISHGKTHEWRQKAVNGCAPDAEATKEKAKVRTAHTHTASFDVLMHSRRKRNLFDGGDANHRQRCARHIWCDGIFHILMENRSGRAQARKNCCAKCNLKIDWNHQQGCRWHHNQRRQTEQETKKGRRTQTNARTQFGRDHDEEDKRSKPAFVCS